MAVKPEFRWWILSLVLIGVLVGISLLAMDRPNVVWREGEPFCPHCRSDVASFSSHCRTCSEQYDWGVAPDEDSPLSPWSLSALEAKVLVDRIMELGDEAATERVAKATGLLPESAHAYLQSIGRGRCGFCGGTGSDLARKSGRGAKPCPVCLGRGECVACDGNRRMRVGDEGAFRALRRYAVAVEDLDLRLPDAVRRKEVRDLGNQFLRRFSGTIEATQILFWPAVDVNRTFLDSIVETPAEVLEAACESTASPTAVAAARDRLDAVLEAVAGE